MNRVTVRRGIEALDDGMRVTRIDTLAAEEPLEIRLGGSPLAVTMRTPGDDFDLVAGFLLTEGVVTSVEQLSTMRYCPGEVEGVNTYNVIDVDLAADVAVPATALSRNFYVSSSCGVCGKASIDAIRTRTAFDVRTDDVRTPSAVLTSLPDRLREAQRVFDATGGLHAAGLFAADGSLVCLREDVGRHNAVDKVVGWAVRESRVPLSGHVLLVSGRASFELVQKALMAGVPVVAAVSAPSSLAVELADECGVTLVGFLRGSSMNVYAGAERIT